MFTTPAPPFDVAAVLPEVAPFARSTVRLHPRAGSPTVEQSSMGGPLLWPADEPWPLCDGPELYDHYPDAPAEAAVPLVPILQLLADDLPELPFPAGTDLLQVLWCPFDHDPWCAPRPQMRWRRRADIRPGRQLVPAPDANADPRRIPAPCALHPERVVEYPSNDLPRSVRDQIRDTVERIERETGWHYDFHLSVASGTKVGGYPGWIQFPDWPDCECGATMEHLVTVTGWEFSRGDDKRWITVEDRPAMAGWDGSPEDHPFHSRQNPTGMMIGDGGGIYVFVCLNCPDRPFDYRFDNS